jgi:hypothetical protein
MKDQSIKMKDHIVNKEVPIIIRKTPVSDMKDQSINIEAYIVRIETAYPAAEGFV